MKKNKMMRTASGLMIATLLTTGVISGTFAKYTTSDSAGDTARVAKWGVNLAVSGSLYGQNYTDADNENIATTTAEGATVASKNTVAAANGLVAPGTNSDDNNGGLRVSLSGTPEVSTKVYGTVKVQNIYLDEGQYGVMVEVKGITTENFKERTYYKESDGTYKFAENASEAKYKLEDTVKTTETYYPVKYTNKTTTTATTSDDSLKNIAKKYAEALAEDSNKIVEDTKDGYTIYTVAEVNATEYIPGDDLSNKFSNTLNDQIKWTWDYDITDTDSEANKKDTILGNMMAKEIDAENASDVVYKAQDSDTTYTAIKVDATTGLVTAGDLTVASLHTGFNIEITATQVD